MFELKNTKKTNSKSENRIDYYENSRKRADREFEFEIRVPAHWSTEL